MAWQFPAEDATALADGFGELAAQLGVRGLADNRESVASVHAVLARPLLGNGSRALREVQDAGAMLARLAQPPGG